MQRKQSELTVITKAKDLCSYIMIITEKSPKRFRFTFVSSSRRRTKRNYKKKLDYLEYAYAGNMVGLAEVKQVISSYNAHLSHGHTFQLRKKLLHDFWLKG